MTTYYKILDLKNGAYLDWAGVEFMLISKENVNKLLDNLITFVPERKLYEFDIVEVEVDE